MSEKMSEMDHKHLAVAVQTEKAGDYRFSETEVIMPEHDTDVILVLPSGEKIQVQYRTCNDHPSIDVCLPYDTPVINCQGDDMEPAPAGDTPEERIAKQLIICLKDESVWVE